MGLNSECKELEPILEGIFIGTLTILLFHIMILMGLVVAALIMAVVVVVLKVLTEIATAVVVDGTSTFILLKKRFKRKCGIWNLMVEGSNWMEPKNLIYFWKEYDEKKKSSNELYATMDIYFYKLVKLLNCLRRVSKEITWSSSLQDTIMLLLSLLSSHSISWLKTYF